MPSRLDDPSEWTMNLQPGPDCSVGYSANEATNWDGSTSAGRENEDRYYTCIYQDRIQLYMVLDGHDGSRAVKFAQSYIPHILLHSELMGGDQQAMEALKNAIVKTEREFFIKVDPYITRKVTLQYEIEQKAPDASSSLAYRMFPTQIAEIGRLDDLIKGGTTVVAALLYNNRLYVANVGDSRALLCAQSQDGALQSVQQLSVDHNTSNNDELCRLEKCGLDPNALRRTKRLGMQQNTRSIGDYSIKGGYTNVDIIKHAICEPGTAEPYLHNPISLTTFHGFLILMSDGLYEAYEAWTRRPDRINEDIAHLVAMELRNSSGDFKLVAQKVVDKVKVLYRDTCKRDRRSGRLDDITLIVKSFGGKLMRSQSTKLQHYPQPHPSQHQAPPTAPITTNQQFRFPDPRFPYQQPNPDYFSRYPEAPGGRPPRPLDQSWPIPTSSRHNASEMPPYSHQYSSPYPRQYSTGGRYPGEQYPPTGGRYPGEQHPPTGGQYPGEQYPPTGGQYPGEQYPPTGGQYPGEQYPPTGGQYPGEQYPPTGGQYPGEQYLPTGGQYPREQYPPSSSGQSLNASVLYSDSEYHNPPPTSHHSSHNHPSPANHPPPQLDHTPEHTSRRNSANRPFTPPNSDTRPQQATEETVPPLPPRVRNPSTSSNSSIEGVATEKPQMSAIAEEYEMYGWTPEPGEEKLLPLEQGINPASTEEVPVPVEEPQTLKEEPATLSEVPDSLRTIQEPVKDFEKPTADVEDGSSDDDYLVVEDEELSSPDDDEQDGDGAIRSYIRFDKQFPVDLSWSEIPS